MSESNEPKRMQRWDRREFLQRSALIGTAAVVSPALSRPAEAAQNNMLSSSREIRSLAPTMLMNGTISFSQPLLSPSQVSFRIGLARTRMSSYPCDSMDFVMMDLERPDHKSRHAHWCTGDLTGRLLEFLCCTEGVDGVNDPRLDDLFERILRQQRAPGHFVPDDAPTADMAPQENPNPGAAGSKVFHGMVRYYQLTGEKRALTAAQNMAQRLWSVRDVWTRGFKPGGVLGDILPWVGEPLARLYRMTQDPRWLSFCRIIRENLPSCENRICHSHGFLSSLRGLQVMTLMTGDLSWNRLVDQDYKIISENRMALPDGNIPERFPRSERNEGCSIADWMMLNLNQGLIHGDDAAYDKAERVFWNALAYNQLVTGGFGHRRITATGYGVDKIHEAWWCCTQTAGMAMAEFARQAVTFHKDTIRVNFLAPGRFLLPLPGDKWARIHINTAYPHRAEATVEADGVPDEISLKIRVPSSVINPHVDQERIGDKIKVFFHGKIGHRIEPCHPGVILTYGPLVLVPAKGVESGLTSASDEGGVPAGYIPNSLPAGIPKIKLDKPVDPQGFVCLPLCPPERPLPTWSYYDEGPGARTWVDGAAVEVNLEYPSGTVVPVRFTPMCFNTSILSLFETPVVFQDAKT